MEGKWSKEWVGEIIIRVHEAVLKKTQHNIRGGQWKQTNDKQADLGKPRLQQHKNKKMDDEINTQTFGETGPGRNIMMIITVISAKVEILVKLIIRRLPRGT